MIKCITLTLYYPVVYCHNIVGMIYKISDKGPMSVRCFLDTTSCCCTIMYEINNIIIIIIIQISSVDWIYEVVWSNFISVTRWGGV